MSAIPKLYPFQREGVDFLKTQKGIALVADEQGLGKTIQLLYYCWQNYIAPTVIVCPAFLKRNWAREAKKFGLKILILEGRKSRPINFVPDLIIINYEILHEWRNEILRLDPQLVCFDEGHYLANPQSQRTRNSKYLASYIPRRVILTGTPVTNSPADLFPLLEILDSTYWDSSFTFYERYCEKMESVRGKWKFSGASNLDELHMLLKRDWMIRRTKKQVLPDLPPKTRCVIPLEIEDRKEYEFAERDLIAWLRSFDAAKADSASHNQRLVKFGYLLRLAAKLKLKSALAWIDNHLASTTGKKLIFCRHREGILDQLETHFGRYAVSIHGGRSHAQREEAELRFQTDPKIDVLLGQIDACGTGLNLTAADASIHLELAMKPSIHSQAEARCHRIGTTEPIFAYYLIAEGTIEERLCEIIQAKQEMFDQVIEGQMFTEESLRIYDELQSAMTRSAA